MQASLEERDAKAAGRHRYDYFGLSFEMPQAVPGLPEAAGDGGDVIRVAFGPAPAAIENADYTDTDIQASGSQYLFRYADVMRLHVRGADITVERLPGCDQTRLWTMVFGMGASIVGLQRGHIPLHASAIRHGQGCIALAGGSSHGKSTLAASLVNLGLDLHADDLCLLRPQGDGFAVGSGVRELRVWDDDLDRLGWQDRQAFAPVPLIAKSIYRLPATTPTSLPLKRIYVLDFTAPGEETGIFRLEGIAALEALLGCLRFRPGLLSVGDRRQTFERLASASSTVAIFRFARPEDKSQLDYWTRQLAEHFNIEA